MKIVFVAAIFALGVSAGVFAGNSPIRGSIRCEGNIVAVSNIDFGANVNFSADSSACSGTVQH